MTASDDAPGQIEQVKRYYDRNTARFQRLGEGGASIHRGVWAPGVSTREQAFHYVDDGVLSLVADVTSAPGSSTSAAASAAASIHLAGRRPDLVGEGITISPAQADVAATLVAEAGVADRVRVREGDFLAPPDDLAGADLALSIEAFVHGPDPAAYFRAAAGAAAARRRAGRSATTSSRRPAQPPRRGRRAGSTSSAAAGGSGRC